LKKTISITVQPHYKRDDTLLYFFFIQNKIHKVEYTTIHYFQKKKKDQHQFIYKRLYFLS
jgi:hypothetical protein